MELHAPWRYRTTVLGTCMAVYFASRAVQVAVSTLGPDIVASLGLTMGLFGLAFTALSLMSALAQLPSGVLGDRYGERVVILSATVITGVGALLLALVPVHQAFVPLMVFVGVGSGLYYSPSVALLDELFDGVGGAIGTYRVSGQLAGVVTPVLVGVVSFHLGWRAALLATGLLLVAALGAVRWAMRPTAPNAPGGLPVHASPRRLLEVVSRPAIAGTTMLAAVVQFVEVASFTFLPAVLRRHHGLSATMAGGLYATYFATVAAVHPVAGWLSDRLGRDAVTGMLLLAGVVGFGLLARQTSIGLLTLAVVLAGVSMTWGAPVQSRIVDRLREEERGTGFGLVRTLYLLVGSLGSYVVGVLVTRAGWEVAFGALAALLGASVVALATTQLLRVRPPALGG